MSLKQITLAVALYTIAVTSVFQTGHAEGVRLCGRRLADILNFICERHGGFHVPRIRRDAAPRSKSMQSAGTIMRSLNRRSDAGEFPGMESNHGRGGVVDECCKKQCTLTTLVSYCANAQDIENINLNDILSSGAENMPIVSEESIAELPRVSYSNFSSFAPVSSSGRLAHISRPNLGLSNRDRSVFIVLSQLQDDEDKALGEYRF